MFDAVADEILVQMTDRPAPIEVLPLNGDIREQYIVILRNPTHPDRGISFSDGLSWDQAHRVANMVRNLCNIPEDTQVIDEATYNHYASSAERRHGALARFADQRRSSGASGLSDDRTFHHSFSSPSAPSTANECPICFEAVTMETSVRCLSVPCHFFHDACLGRWIGQFHRSIPNCPVCRQAIEIDTQLLRQYMNDPRSDMEIGPDDRQRLQYLLDARLNAWTVVHSAAKDARIIVDVPMNMYRGVTHGFHSLSETENERLDEGLRLMRSFLRVAYLIFPDDAGQYHVSLWRPHSYFIRWFKQTRQYILDWTFARLQQTEREVEEAREYDEENIRIEEFNTARQ